MISKNAHFLAAPSKGAEASANLGRLEVSITSAENSFPLLANSSANNKTKR